MRPGRLVDAPTAAAIGFGWLREALKPRSSYGEAAFGDLLPFAPHRAAQARARAARIERIAAALDSEQLDEAREVARHVPDVTSAIARASMGDVLEDANFFELQRFFEACERLDALTAACNDLPRTASTPLRECARVLESGRTARPGFYLADAFDDSLAQVRAAFVRAQAQYEAARGRANAAVAEELGREISPPEFIVMRADLRGPLPAGVRVVREAPTYLLCELDADETVLAALRRRDETAAEVARAEGSVRARISETIRAHVPALDHAMQAFGQCDVLIAAARFTRAQRCHVAELADDGVFSFEGGRFVPLALELQTQGRRFTAIDVRLDGIAVLTGPNMGGKSVALRTCGFIALCAAFGVPVPAARARVPLFSEIAWLGIGGDGESSAGDLLSSFAREIVRLRDLLGRRAGPRLFLLDEFARTTTPREGKALLVAVIERLREEDASGFAATHLDGIAKAAAARHYAVRGLRGIPERPAGDDLEEALETLAASMDYTLEEVAADGAREADAIALAALLGIDPAVIDAAHRAMESE
ncbi:MAG TPA: hypothetical protein VMF11_12655 [Candidatus Baltobacteraceae bacterium]|nr:hypothetical protein [Candidatus Baltobacteraceae bacterium]